MSVFSENEDQQSSTSSVSSSPFELCEIVTETKAVVENGENKGTLEKLLSHPISGQIF